MNSPFYKGDRVIYTHGHAGATVKATVEAVHSSGVEIVTDDSVRGYDRLIVPSAVLTKTGYVSLDTLMEVE